MAPTLSTDSASKLDSLLDRACLGDAKIIPYCSLRVTNKKGDVLYHHAVGDVSPQSAEGTTLSSRTMAADGDKDAFMLASSTKLITAVAAMQLVEKGKISLDDPEVIARTLPELVAQKVLVGFEDGSAPRKPILRDLPVDAKKITLRMLMNHVSGLGYTPFNKLGWEFIGSDMLESEPVNLWKMLTIPLINDPGTGWYYSGGFEYIGMLIERFTGRTLQDYFTTEICAPLAMKNTKFAPEVRPEDAAKPLPIYARTGANSFVQLPIAFPPVAKEDIFPVGKVHVYSGGGNIVSTINDYSKLTSALLNGGSSPDTGASILSPATVAELTSPQLPEGTPFTIDSYTTWATSCDLAADVNPRMNWTPGGAYQGSDRSYGSQRGRKQGSYYWSGVMNTNWWIDPSSGIAVELWTGLLPWNDEAWLRFMDEVEAEIYAGLSG